MTSTSSQPRRVLVTGGAGFIGSHLVELLLARGERVRVLDSLVRGSRENLAAAQDAELIVGDIRDDYVVARAMRNVDVVYHLAALTSVAESFARPDEYIDVCTMGTRCVMRTASAFGVGRLVYASTAAVYGNQAKLPLEESTPTSPASPYGLGSLLGEQVCTVGADVESVRLRLFNVYGPRQDGSGSDAPAAAAFMSAIRAGRPVGVRGTGLQTRDLVHVSDAVRALALAGAATGIGGRVFNIGTGRPTSMLELAGAAHLAAGRRPQIEFQPSREREVKHSVAAVAGAAAGLGFRAEVTVAAGLASLWERERATVQAA